MKKSEKTLIEQFKITQREIARRKEYLGITEADCSKLLSLRELIGGNVEEIVEQFYEKLLFFNEIDSVIGDAETLRRLKNHLRLYILTMFDGQYDEEYVHSRLRVGVVHKRIGVDPKFYVSAVYNLISILRNIIISNTKNDCVECNLNLSAIDKIVMFDLSLTFDTYINSLMDEVRNSKKELEVYTESLEQVVSERTRLLSEQARHDGLTNLLNQRSFYSELRRELLRGQRGKHATVLIYIDLDGFKKLNDSKGHKHGDEILVAVAQAMKTSLRETDIAARYGGDEFCVILPESSVEKAKQVCNKLCETIRKKTEDSGISCSMGIAISLPENDYDANSLVKKADAAMYEAKKEPGFTIKLAKV